MDKLQHVLEAKEAQMQRVVNGTGQVSALKQHYDRVLTDLAGERDVLQADRTRLLQVCCGHEQTFLLLIVLALSTFPVACFCQPEVCNTGSRESLLTGYMRQSCFPSQCKLHTSLDLQV